MGFIICLFIAISLIAKEKKTDYHCRRHSAQHGYDMYASSTGLRYTKDNSLVFSNK